MAGIFKRVSDIVNASVNDLLDRVEDPERMLKQMVREMQSNITAAKTRVIDAVANEKQLHRQVEHHRDQAAEWLAKAEEALKAGDEGVARAALERKAEHDNIVTALRPQWEAVCASCATLKEQLNALENKLEEAKRKQTALLARQKSAEAHRQIDEVAEELTSNLSAEATLARVEDKVVALEVRAEAAAEVGRASASLNDDFQRMESNAAAEADLAALKRKLEMD